jgi:FtsZ-binding cell division protein ZapB
MNEPLSETAQMLLDGNDRLRAESEQLRGKSEQLFIESEELRVGSEQLRDDSDRLRAEHDWWRERVNATRAALEVGIRPGTMR